MPPLAMARATWWRDSTLASGVISASSAAVPGHRPLDQRLEQAGAAELVGLLEALVLLDLLGDLEKLLVGRDPGQRRAGLSRLCSLFFGSSM